MQRPMRPFILCFCICILFCFAAGAQQQQSEPLPNIIFILADDMGYGDVKAFNQQSRIETPQLDRLAASGMIFTDAHASASSCVPSRYGLLTGRFPFRMRSYKWRKEPLIDEDRLTIAGVLKNGGYRTGMVGKWHLGFDYSDLNDLRGGPVDRGFDYYFGISRSLDQGDYYYIENRRAVQPPTESVEGSPGHGRHGWQGPFWRAGKAGKDFKHEQVLSMFIQKSIDFIEGAAEGSDPFFLYLALASPHTPWLVSEEFRGTSEIGDWGDWVAENDHAIGKVLQALYDQGLRENTLIFFTSDNGPIWWPEDTKTSGHSATSVYRGMKFDVWEGGHRMPFIASWPGVVEAGSRSEQMISNTDMLATFADLVGETLPIDAGEDSYSFLNALYGSDGGRPIRETLVGQALDVRPDRDMLYIRQGDWKLMRTVVGKKLLYNLSEDPSETTNMYKENKAKGRELKQLLKKYRRSARSTPGRGE